MRWAAKTDANHQQLMDAFRALGCSVLDLSRLGQGAPDLLVGKLGRSVLVEVKRDKKASLTDDQIKFMGAWKGAVMVVTDTFDVEKAVRFLVRDANVAS